MFTACEEAEEEAVCRLLAPALGFACWEDGKLTGGHGTRSLEDSGWSEVVTTASLGGAAGPAPETRQGRPPPHAQPPGVDSALPPSLSGLPGAGLSSRGRPDLPVPRDRNSLCWFPGSARPQLQAGLGKGSALHPGLSWAWGAGGGQRAVL